MTEDGHAERMARNEALFREVNERIESITTRPDPMLTEFLCECGDGDCREYVKLTNEEYSGVRRKSPAHFFVKPGHVIVEIEQVVGGESDRYEIVRKLGEAAEVAKKLDRSSD